MEEGSKSLGSLVGCDGVSRVRWARLPPVEAGAVGEHGRPRLAGRSAVRAVVGPPRASGIGEDRVRSPSRAGGTARTLWPAVIGGLRCCGAAF